VAEVEWELVLEGVEEGVRWACEGVSANQGYSSLFWASFSFCLDLTIDLKLLCRILEDTSTSCEHMGCREPSHGEPAKLDGDGDGMRKGVGMRVG